MFWSYKFKKVISIGELKGWSLVEVVQLWPPRKEIHLPFEEIPKSVGGNAPRSFLETNLSQLFLHFLSQGMDLT